MNETRQNEAEKAVLQVLKYFDYFRYAPTAEQIHTFLPVRMPKKSTQDVLNRMVLAGKLNTGRLKYTGEGIYSVPDRKAQIAHRNKKYHITEGKLQGISTYVTYLGYMPWIDFVGISGSCSTHNAHALDDVDMFIISAPRGMWMARLSAVCIAKLLNIHRRRGAKNVSGKVCLNLFFDGTDLPIPKHKRNLYTAHEVVQIIPMHVRGGVYQRFMHANAWVKKYFPNVVIKRPIHDTSFYLLPFLYILNLGARQLQIRTILSHTTSEIVSDTQLWFFPDDFQKKIQKDIDIDP